MKILVGVCGIGNGHLNRQTNVIKLLQSKKHNYFQVLPYSWF
jgi:UDP:flavonoid glycosyltransferase YjiC (YdhE family)